MNQKALDRVLAEVDVAAHRDEPIPCPFCGKEADIDSRQLIRIGCWNCNIWTGGGMHYSEQLKVWNRRV